MYRCERTDKKKKKKDGFVLLSCDNCSNDIPWKHGLIQVKKKKENNVILKKIVQLETSIAVMGVYVSISVHTSPSG